MLEFVKIKNHIISLHKMFKFASFSFTQPFTAFNKSCGLMLNVTTCCKSHFRPFIQLVMTF